jgi:Flp pilus assembly protein TadD
MACTCALAAVPLAAQGSYSPYNESASAAMARYIRNLASDPKDFDSLIGAGRAALALDDPQAAAGFFARADEVNPRSPLPQAGMGAVSVANGDARSALPYFKRAQQLGAPLASFACDRGLAFDLLGQQAQAQADYRVALSGSDSDEARKRLALSLAVSGERNSALDALAPLSARSDSGVQRVRAFVLALTGDPSAAMSAANAAMPGSGANAAPFLQRLAALSAAQKAAAVNLGIFPGSDSTYAYAAVQSTATIATNDRLGGIDALLSANSAARRQAPQSAQPTWRQSQPVQVAYAQRPASASVQRTAAMFQPKLWLELASGENVDALAGKFRRLRASDPDVFQGIRPYLATSADRTRLIVGPFRGESDAANFSEDLDTLGVHAVKFSDSESDRIAPLPVE